MTRPTDEALVAAYREHGSVWEAGKALGMPGQSVHRRLAKLGLNRPMNTFSDEERERLRHEYEIFASSGKLEELAKSMGRTRQFLCRQARALGLTNPKRSRDWLATWKVMSDEAALVMWEQFKSSSLGLVAYCRKRGFDDLGFSRVMKEKFADEYEHVIELKQPKQSLYRYGRQFEYRTRDDLRLHRFFVTRSPASKSPVDLVAIRHACVAFVQCKRHGALGVVEWNELFDLSTSVGAIPVLAMVAKAGRGVEYYRLTDRKDGTKRRQPMEPIAW